MSDLSPTENLTEILIESKQSQELPEILKILHYNKRLNKLALDFAPSEGFALLKNLPKFLEESESLTTLEFVFRNFQKNQPITEFLQELQTCTRLCSLSIKFLGCQEIGDSVLICLTQALEKLNTLKHLTFHPYVPDEDDSSCEVTISNDG